MTTFGKRVAAVTTEFENVPAATLEALAALVPASSRGCRAHRAGSQRRSAFSANTACRLGPSL